MTQQHQEGQDASPNWRYEVREVSPGVYRGIARDRYGREASREGTDPDEVLHDLHEWTQAIDQKGIPTHARVRVKLIDVDAGGRSIPPGARWRGLLRMVGSEQDHGIQLLLDPPGSLAPSRTRVGSVVLLFDSGLELAVGRRFEIREGGHVVGVGEITSE